MPPSASAANTFREDEVELLAQLFRTVRRGGDVSVLLRQPAAASVERKVRTMQRSIARQKGAA